MAPLQEIEVLMTVFCKYAERCEKEATEKNIRIRVFSTERNRVESALDPSPAAGC